MPNNSIFGKNSEKNKGAKKFSDVQRDPLITQFYNSSRWRRLAKAYAEEKGYICEACRNKYASPDYKPYYKQFHVHHKIELTRENMDDPEIALNRDNLMLLCQHCHTKITFSREVLEPGLVFDENGMVRKIARKKGDTGKSQR